MPKSRAANFMQTSSSSRSLPFRTTSAASGPRPMVGISQSQHLNDRTRLFDEDGTSAAAAADAAVDETKSYAGEREEEEEEEGNDNDSRLKAPSNFKPFFTLIEDANSSDYHHPTVHYIFSDDDAELMTEASLRALVTGTQATSTSPLPQQPRSDNDTADSGDYLGLEHGNRPSLLPPPIPGIQDRYIVIDIEPASNIGVGNPSSVPDTLAGTSAGTATTVVSTSPAQRQQQGQTDFPFGYRVTSVHSLTPDWQVLDVSLSPAPTFDAPPQQQQQQQTAGEQATVGNNLMLRIRGTDGRLVHSSSTGKGREEQTLEQMMEQFDKRMSELKRVIDTGADYLPSSASTTAVQPRDVVDAAGDTVRSPWVEESQANRSDQAL